MSTNIQHQKFSDGSVQAECLCRAFAADLVGGTLEPPMRAELIRGFAEELAGR